MMGELECCGTPTCAKDENRHGWLIVQVCFDRSPDGICSDKYGIAIEINVYMQDLEEVDIEVWDCNKITTYNVPCVKRIEPSMHQHRPTAQCSNLLQIGMNIYKYDNRHKYK